VDVLDQNQPWWVYVLCCSDNSLYCGITKDLERRLLQHNAGTGARYTKARRPAALIHSWTVPSRGVALREEHAFKALSRQKKIARLKEMSSAGLPDLLRHCTYAASEKS
jgi:putative endonuclease